MKSILRLLSMLGIIAGLVAPTHLSAQNTDPARLQILMDFAAEGLDVSSYKVPPPHIVYVSYEFLQVAAYGVERTRGTGVQGQTFLSVLASYSFDASELRLVDGIDYSRPEHEWVLVHELAHYFQQVYHKLYLDKARCMPQLEPAAYRVSNMWAIATGHGPVYGAFIPICEDD